MGSSFWCGDSLEVAEQSVTPCFCYKPILVVFHVNLQCPLDDVHAVYSG